MNISKPNIDAKSTGGQVGKPQYAGPTVLIPGGDRKVSLHTRTGLNPGASEVNLSKKFKNPQVKQSLAPEQRNQYEDHS